MAKKKSNKEGNGVKYDGGKPWLALVDPDAEWYEGLAMTHGMYKYGKFNYTEGLTVLRILSAAKRHINRIIKGEDFDSDIKDMKVHNIGNARACLGMAMHILLHRPDLDDRWKPEKKIVKKRVVKKKKRR